MKRTEFIKQMFGFLGVATIAPELVKHNQKIYLLECFVRGFQYYRGPEMIDEINKTGLLSLVRERNNVYDKNAIALYFNGEKIGFIPRERNKTLAILMDTNLLELQAEITHIEHSAADWEKIHVAVYAMKEIERNMDLEGIEPYTLLRTPYYRTLQTQVDKL